MDSLPQKYRENGDFLNKLGKWFSGGDSPLTPHDINVISPFANELTAMRKALHSSLRSSLDHKIGLDGDFDPIHFAIGVPSSQGITSATTKYSDPLMQLCLTQMIAMYKPQGEPFLKSAAADVRRTIDAEIKETDDKSPQLPLLKEALEKIDDLLARQKSGDTALNFRKELTGNAPVDIFLRLKFAEQVGLRGLIYVSENQISRPVQHALRECNIIGLTGTATLNTEYIVTSNGHDEGMKSVEEEGRVTTAEVLYRFEKSLPQGTNTPIKTYPLDAKAAQDKFKFFADSENGYSFLINQAGSCDQMPLHTIVEALASDSKRPIVFLDTDNEGRSEKRVYIDGKYVPLSKYSDEQKHTLYETAFFYYHTPHVRGTHFSIPTGSKGALLLSPTVNANDFAQAAYRARELGEGHLVEPFISDKQHQEIGQGDEVTVGQVFKVLNQQTKEDESKEDLSAYQLHIKGQTVRAAEKAKAELQFGLGKPKKTKDLLNVLSIQSNVFALLEKLFIEDSGNEAYFRSLAREALQGGETPTNEYLQKVVIQSEIKRIDRFLSEIEDNFDPDLKKPLELVANTMKAAKEKLELEAAGLDKKWNERLHLQFPAKTASASTAQETAETEAEAEAEEQQETTSETAAEVERRKRNKSTKAILTEVDDDLLSGLESTQSECFIIPDAISSYLSKGLGEKQGTFPGAVDWNPKVVVTNQLAYFLKMAVGGSVPEVKLLAVDFGDHKRIIAATPAEADHITGPEMGFVKFTGRGEKLEVFNGCSIKPVINAEGDLKLSYSESTRYVKGLENEFENDKSLQAEMYLTLIRLGHTQIGEDGWDTVTNYWRDLDDETRTNLQTNLEKTMSHSPFLVTLGKRLWNKEQTKKMDITGKVIEKVEKPEITDINEAKKLVLKNLLLDPFDKRLGGLTSFIDDNNIQLEDDNKLLDWTDEHRDTLNRVATFLRNEAVIEHLDANHAEKVKNMTIFETLYYICRNNLTIDDDKIEADLVKVRNNIEARDKLIDKLDSQ